MKVAHTPPAKEIFDPKLNIYMWVLTIYEIALR